MRKSGTSRRRGRGRTALGDRNLRRGAEAGAARIPRQPCNPCKKYFYHRRHISGSLSPTMRPENPAPASPWVSAPPLYAPALFRKLNACRELLHTAALGAPAPWGLPCGVLCTDGAQAQAIVDIKAKSGRQSAALFCRPALIGFSRPFSPASAVGGHASKRSRIVNERVYPRSGSCRRQSECETTAPGRGWATMNLPVCWSARRCD